MRLEKTTMAQQLSLGFSGKTSKISTLKELV